MLVITDLCKSSQRFTEPECPLLFYTVEPLVDIFLSHVHPFKTLTHYLRYVLIFHLYLDQSSNYCPFRFFDQSFQYNTHLSIRATLPYHFVLFGIFTLTVFCKECPSHETCKYRLRQPVTSQCSHHGL